MFTKKVRFLVISIFSIILCWTIYLQVYEVSVIAFLGICLLVWGHFREGTVIMAAREFHAKNYERAEELLNDIEYPEHLGKNRRGFYEFIYGSIELHRANFEKAERHFQIASRFKLRNSNDKAIVLIHLANINLRKKDTERALTYLEKAKHLEVTSRVKQIIEKIELQINQQHNEYEYSTK